jgi:hypothetical protein
MLQLIGVYKKLTYGYTPYLLQRFPAPPVPGIPPHAMYKVDPGIGLLTGQPGPSPLFDFHPVSTTLPLLLSIYIYKHDNQPVYLNIHGDMFCNSQKRV